ncbi:hypothetical protein [Cupriavidus alkaliphilus]|uniref:hypothetical protein n=1 Tax=Cupriavidus alkaliphilus TaxID=942866 RepID=UPI00081606B5|nr:hypothetical protein [Cupriavidus alkaliphilus]SCB26030.1 hypothetical protein GA0116996_1085 [Cupriavidus alkaliphilus]
MPDLVAPHQPGSPGGIVAELPAAAFDAGGAYESFYQRVHGAMRDGDFDAARQLLLDVERLPLPHAGARLDIAIALCELGERERAFTQFSQLQGGADVPPAIRVLIDSYVRGGCTRPDPRLRGQLSLQAGYTTNANYGPRNPVVPLAPGASVPYLLLQPSQLAQADRFAGMDGSVNWGTGGVEGLNVSAGASIRQYARRHDYSQYGTSLAVHYGSETRVGLVEGQAALGYTWLGGRPYQYGGSMLLGYWLPERQLAGKLYRVGIDTSMALDRYPDGHAFDARRHDLRLRGRLDLAPNMQVSAAVGVIRDLARNERAGGDRDGYAILANLTWLPHPRHLVVALAQRQELRDRQPYFRALFGDTRRRQVLSQVLLRYTYRHATDLSFYVQGLYQQSDDSIPLFRYRAGSVSTGVLMEF